MREPRTSTVAPTCTAPTLTDPDPFNRGTLISSRLLPDKPGLYPDNGIVRNSLIIVGGYRYTYAP
jgi:hypothetical protein